MPTRTEFMNRNGIELARQASVQASVPKTLSVGRPLSEVLLKKNIEKYTHIVHPAQIGGANVALF